MATQAEYAAVAAALQKLIQGEIDADVPGFFKGMIPADLAEKLATESAKTAVDTLDAIRGGGPPKGN